MSVNNRYASAINEHQDEQRSQNRKEHVLKIFKKSTHFHYLFSSRLLFSASGR